MSETNDYSSWGRLEERIISFLKRKSHILKTDKHLVGKMILPAEQIIFQSK